MYNPFYRSQLQQSRPYTYSLVLIVFMTLWHLFLAGQVNLSVDEAHYALYGVKLDWSYFDHPSMVGWLNAIPTFFSHSDRAMRILPILFFALSNWILYHLATRLYPDFRWVGFWTLVLINSAFMFQLLSTSMLPDTPLMVAALMVVWTLLNLRSARETQHGTFKYWIYMGIWIGVAGLSKYTSVVLVFSLMLVVLLERRWYWLTDKGLWTAVLIAATLILPVLYWNHQHDWISFLYQIHHGTYNTDWQWSRVLETQLAQLALYTPILYLIGLWVMMTSWFNASPSTKLLGAFSLPVILLFAMNSGYEMSLPHWTQLAWLFIAPSSVYWIWKHWQTKALRLFVYIGGTLSLVFAGLLNTQLAFPWMPVKSDDNPVRELHGWPQAIAEAQKLQQRYPGTALFAANWSQASRIAWYAYPQKVYVTDNRFDQFDLWYGNPESGSDGILIIPSYEQKPPATGSAGHFQQCRKVEQLPITRLQTTIVTYSFYHCTDFHAPQYQGWVTQLPLVKKMQANQN
ncbi:MAG: glycosyltransferase family 39 protein [Hydrogenovibrio sp.]|nr:glycosyltransferase family 39 protein [Hydrogenovibrio sp.]